MFASILSFIIYSQALLTVIASSSKESITGDMYVLAYTWTPEFCYGQSSYASCKTPQDYWGKYFTLHGLWPQYSTGGYPATCSTEKFNSSVPNQVGWSDMTKYWPNAQYFEADSLYDSFWDHEWTKHGTCTGLTQYDYFYNGLDMIKKFGTPSTVTNAVGGSLPATTLLSAFGGPTYVALQCASGKYLSGAYTCWSQSKGIPQSQIVCPTDVQKEDTCTQSTIYIQSF